MDVETNGAMTRQKPLPALNLDSGRLSLFHSAMVASEKASDNPLNAQLAKRDRRQAVARRHRLILEWSDYHERMHLLHQRIADEHAAKRSKLLQEISEEASTGEKREEKE